MTSGPIIVGIISGPKVIESWRDMMGATRPEEALPGTIRGDFAKAAGRKSSHSKRGTWIRFRRVS